MFTVCKNSYQSHKIVDNKKSSMRKSCLCPKIDKFSKVYLHVRKIKSACNIVNISLRNNLQGEDTHPTGNCHINPVYTQKINPEKVVTW